MAAELAAKDFYLAFAERFGEVQDLSRKLEYFASMEDGHYKILEVELQNIERYEDYDDYWPMMHMGT